MVANSGTCFVGDNCGRCSGVDFLRSQRAKESSVLVPGRSGYLPREWFLYVSLGSRNWHPHLGEVPINGETTQVCTGPKTGGKATYRGKMLEFGK
jgi:hypothetical protein